MENLVGRKVLCTQSYDVVTKGKEYTITNIDNSGFYIIEDDGRKRNWCTSHLQLKEYFELLPKETQFKQGDKVLVSDDEMEWYERYYALSFNNKHYVQSKHSESELTNWQYIRPYEDETKVGDWVKRISDETIWLIENKEDIDLAKRTDCEIITNPQLIELLNKEL